jgi:hypothetical protein
MFLTAPVARDTLVTEISFHTPTRTHEGEHHGLENHRRR